MAHDENEPTPEDMQARVARFADLVPYKDTMNAAHGIAPEAMQMMSSDKVYPVMSPEGWEGRSKIAPVKGAAGLTVTIAECPPGMASRCMPPASFDRRIVMLSLSKYEAFRCVSL